MVTKLKKFLAQPATWGALLFSYTAIAIGVTSGVITIGNEAESRSNADQASLIQRDRTDQRLTKAVEGNCIVLGVLLEGRADRDETVKLFDAIRERNPEQFDALIQRAEKQDIRLRGAVPLLSCDIPKNVLQKLDLDNGKKE